MADELELKAPVEAPEVLRERLREAGATLARLGTMIDRRYHEDDRLARRDEVLRVRTFEDAEGRIDCRLTWKGPARLLGSLGYRVSAVIDRWVEYWQLEDAQLRIEWYPRMDVLLEVEGEPAAIERAIVATGLPRRHFTAESLSDFVRRYEARTGRRAAVVLDQLGDGEAPAWSSQ